MSAQAIRTLAPVVTLSNNRVVTTSKDVADCFNKHHRDVLRAIENLLADLPEDHQRNFAQTLIERPNPSGGAPIKSPAYEITRDGFTLLAMGFTGKKALQFKLAYIDAFNQMEAKLRELSPGAAESILNATIGTDGYRVLGALIAGKTRKLPAPVRRSAVMKLWSQVHAAFNVRRAEDIPADQLDSARNFVAAYVLQGELLDAEPACPTINETVANLVRQLEAPNGVPAVVFMPLVNAVLRKQGYEIAPKADSSKIVVDRKKLAAIWADLGKLRERVDGLGVLDADLPAEWWSARAIC